MSDCLFWFRRDLRLHDNAGLYSALKTETSVRPLFIFDRGLLTKLKNPRDTRVPFLFDQVLRLKNELNQQGSDLEVFYGEPSDVFQHLIKTQKIRSIYLNHDYEPGAIKRDSMIQKSCELEGVEFHSFKDHVVFEKEEILTQALKPYTVYTPYKKKWLASLSPFYLQSYPTEKYSRSFKKISRPTVMPSLEEMGFERNVVTYPPATLLPSILKAYADLRDLPGQAGTSRLGLHLRFGTLSVRDLARQSKEVSPVWLSELIWREFFIQILFHFPRVANESFRPEFEKVEWRDSRSDLNRWKEGTTGYPLVDAGMRELHATGFMHNRVRMVVASFLCKHLLQHWSKGEKHFAAHLLDYEMAVNNGNWQWAAGTGCDAAPYFRVFNPETQRERFDPDEIYIRKWLPEWGTSRYPKPMIEHGVARDRALRAFAMALKGKKK